MEQNEEQLQPWGIVITVILFLVIAGIFVFGVRGGGGRAMAKEEVCICHNVEHNPVTVCSDDDSYKEGHGKHLKNGFDTYGACVIPTGTPTATVTPTARPTVTPIISVTPTITPIVTETPPVTPTARPTGASHPPVFARSSTEAPVCTQTNPDAVVNPHVYRKGDTAVVKWWPMGGNKAVVYYKQVTSPGWDYSVTVDNTGYAEVHGLGSMDISFAVQAVNDCSGGVSVMSPVIIDGNTDGWVLFK